MNSKRVVNTVISILLMILFFRFIGLIFRFWYISVPIILAIYFYFKRKIAILKQEMFNQSRKSSNKKDSGADEIIDAEFTVVEEDDDE